MKVSDVDMEKKPMIAPFHEQIVYCIKDKNSSSDTAIFPLKNDKLIYDQS